MRGRGGFLDGAGGGGVGAQVDHPGAPGARLGACHDWDPRLPGGRACGPGDGCVVGVARLRRDDQQQVRAVPADRVPDELGEIGSRMAAESAVGETGYRDLGDAQDISG